MALGSLKTNPPTAFALRRFMVFTADDVTRTLKPHRTCQPCNRSYRYVNDARLKQIFVRVASPRISFGEAVTIAISLAAGSRSG